MNSPCERAPRMDAGHMGTIATVVKLPRLSLVGGDSAVCTQSSPVGRLLLLLHWGHPSCLLPKFVLRPSLTLAGSISSQTLYECNFVEEEEGESASRSKEKKVKKGERLQSPNRMLAPSLSQL